MELEIETVWLGTGGKKEWRKRISKCMRRELAELGPDVRWMRLRLGLCDIEIR